MGRCVPRKGKIVRGDSMNRINRKPILIDTQLGPYPALEAEQVTEEILDSKEHYISVEQFLKGDTTEGEFMFSFKFLAESIRASIKEKEREQKAEACHDPYLEEA